MKPSCCLGTSGFEDLLHWPLSGNKGFGCRDGAEAPRRRIVATLASTTTRVFSIRDDTDSTRVQGLGYLVVKFRSSTWHPCNPRTASCKGRRQAVGLPSHFPKEGAEPSPVSCLSHVLPLRIRADRSDIGMSRNELSDDEHESRQASILSMSSFSAPHPCQGCPFWKQFPNLFRPKRANESNNYPSPSPDDKTSQTHSEDSTLPCPISKMTLK